MLNPFPSLRTMSVPYTVYLLDNSTANLILVLLPDCHCHFSNQRILSLPYIMLILLSHHADM